MTKIIDPLILIETIRDSHSKMVDIFTKGSCLNLFFILKKVYPDARAYCNGDHVITQIGTQFYDITGRVNPVGYKVLTDRPNISQMRRYELKLIEPSN